MALMATLYGIASACGLRVIEHDHRIILTTLDITAGSWSHATGETVTRSPDR